MVNSIPKFFVLLPNSIGRCASALIISTTELLTENGILRYYMTSNPQPVSCSEASSVVVGFVVGLLLTGGVGT